MCIRDRYQTWLPAYMEMQQHISIAKTGLLASVPLVCAFFGALCGGYLSDRLVKNGMELIASRRLPLVIGLLLSAAFTGCLLYTSTRRGPISGRRLHRRS